MSNTRHLLISIANYNNSVEVNNFIKSIEINRLAEYFNITIIVVDNSSNFTLEYVDERITVINKEKNFGYLGASEVSLQSFITQYGYYPDFLMITNTDLEIPKGFFHFLGENDFDDTIGQISTVITTSDGKRQNPYLKKRLFASRMYFYLFIFSNFVTGYFYLFLSTKKKVTPQKDVSYEDYVLQYASHGSFFLLTKSFFNKGGVLERDAFLYGEELYIAEQLRLNQLKSICVSKFNIIHNEHRTTSSIGVKRRVNWYFESYFELIKKFY